MCGENIFFQMVENLLSKNTEKRCGIVEEKIDMTKPQRRDMEKKELELIDINAKKNDDEIWMDHMGMKVLKFRDEKLIKKDVKKFRDFVARGKQAMKKQEEEKRRRSKSA